MDNQKGPYWEDVERNRIFTIALIYEKAADQLAHWDAAEAEACYRKRIDLLMPLAPVSFGLAETLRKLAEVLDKQGKEEQADVTRKHYNEMKLKLAEIEPEMGRKHSEMEAYANKQDKEIFDGVSIEVTEHDRKLAMKYKAVLESPNYASGDFADASKLFISRGISLCVGNPVGGILLTGVNPSQNKKHDGIDFAYTFENAMINAKRDCGNGKKNYWTWKYELLGDDFIRETAYLDLFPLVFSKQVDFEARLENNLQFRTEMISITQREIECHIKPKLIIVANKQSSYYWGRNEDATWMGYDMVKVCDDMELYQIRGFKDKPDRLNPDLETSSLCGSLILFYGMYDNRHKDRLLFPADIKRLYENAKKMKSEWKG